VTWQTPLPVRSKRDQARPPGTWKWLERYTEVMDDQQPRLGTDPYRILGVAGEVSAGQRHPTPRLGEGRYSPVERGHRPGRPFRASGG